MLESQAKIAQEQYSSEKQTLDLCQTKYRQMKDEFKKMKEKYESELTNCVQEMENLRIIVTDVVSS